VTETLHPAGLKATSTPDGDTVMLRLPVGTGIEIEKSVLLAIAASHCGPLQRGRWGEYLTATETRRLEHGVTPHEFDPGYSGIACCRMVMRADFGEDCGLPASSKVHI
jgi:hypothetical protein